MNNELNLEKIHLKEVVDKVINAKQSLEERLDVLGKDNLDKLADLKENPETNALDLYQFIEQLHEKNSAFNVKDKFQRIDELEFSSKEPYFARIDLQNSEIDQNDQLYIGKFGYTEKDPVITDWRTKVASVYYRYRFPQKNVKYETPDGTVFTDLTLKRTYEIDNGSLIKFFNNDLKLDENEIIRDKIQNRTGGVLEDIVETIQVSQLDIIESDPRQVCIVQGCVGSGKSTVAIHKLSHIFFNYPDLIKPARAILVAKSQILVGYLSTLFPKLGIFDINYQTLRELLVHLAFREELPIELSIGEMGDLASVTTAKITDLKDKINEIHSQTEVSIDNLFKGDEVASFGGFKYSTDSTPYENVSEAIEDLEEELESQKEIVKQNPKSIKALFSNDNIKVLRKLVTNLKKLRIDITHKHLDQILKSENIESKGMLSFKDMLLYIFLYTEVIGLTKFQKYEYCVVDEGQDLSPLEYLVLQKLVIYGRFCILGDLNQGIVKDGITSWDDISEVISAAKHANVFTLDTNYRSTKQIIDLANNILSPYTKDYLPKSIYRVGEEPVIKQFESMQEEISYFKEKIIEDTQVLNKSIGVVVMNQNYYEEVKNILEELNIEKGHYIELNENERINYLPKGVYFTNFENVKGLEFAKLYVLGLNLDDISAFDDAKRAFVAVTRAMNELEVYSHRSVQ